MLAFSKGFLFIIFILPLENFSCQSSIRNGEKMFIKKDPDYVVVGKGNSGWKPSRRFGPQFLVFRSSKTWEENKGQFHFSLPTVDSTAREKLNKINFEEESILIFTFGLKGSTGYSLNVKDLSITNEIVCHLTSNKPAFGERTGAAMRHPFIMVIVEIDSIPDEYKIYIDDKLTDFEVHRFE